MQRRSPPKHRHDGASPLPLGMDWSPPRKWNGRDTVWPHDPHTGWSYCVTIPSWVVLPKSRNSDPVVFYRVQVGVQSPEGITTTRGVLRRFNDFLKLFTDLKKAFRKKNLPPAPSKGILPMKSRALLDERRCSLELWMTKLLSDIGISRSVAVASFLELEAAARSSFQDVNQRSSEANSTGDSTISTLHLHPQSSMSVVAGSSSVTSDYGSDTACETSELGTPGLGRDDNSEIGIEDLTLDEDLTGPIEKLLKYGMSNIDEGLFMGQTILDQLEDFPRHKVYARHINNDIRKETGNGFASKASFLGNSGMEFFSELEYGKVTGHTRKHSTESVGSDGSSLRGSEMSNSGIPNSSGDGSLDLPGGAEVSSTTEILGNTQLQSSGDREIVLPLDQHHKMNRVLTTMQLRLGTAKTDMEDLIARLNQEVAVKDFLATKVKDLEVELEITKQKSKETLHQAILIERERFTQMQWDMEELRRKSLEMEMKLKSEQKRYEELEAKSKADIKLLVKEVKSLRSSQTVLKKELSPSLKEKTEAKQEKQMHEHAITARKKLLQECRILRNQLQEWQVNFHIEGEDKLNVDSSSMADAFDLLTTSDDQIGLLLAEVQLLAQENENGTSGVDRTPDGNEDLKTTDDELRKMLADIITYNATLRKQVNSVIRHALKMEILLKKDDEAAAP